METKLIKEKRIVAKGGFISGTTFTLKIYENSFKNGTKKYQFVLKALPHGFLKKSKEVKYNFPTKERALREFKLKEKRIKIK